MGADAAWTCAQGHSYEVAAGDHRHELDARGAVLRAIHTDLPPDAGWALWAGITLIVRGQGPVMYAGTLPMGLTAPGRTWQVRAAVPFSVSYDRTPLLPAMVGAHDSGPGWELATPRVWLSLGNNELRMWFGLVVVKYEDWRYWR